MSATQTARLERSLLLVPLPLLLVLFYLLPFIGVVSWSFTLPEPGIEQYQRIASDPAIHDMLLRTLRLCLTVSLLALVIGYLLAYCWVFSPPFWQRMVEICVFIPFWISVLVRAFGWLIALRSNGVINDSLLSLGWIEHPLQLTRNELGVVIGMLHFMIPYALFPLLSSMRQLDQRVLLASRGLGAGALRTFWQVLLPQTLPGLLGAFIMVFVFCLGFFITPVLLGGGQTVMIAEYVFLQMFQTSNWGLGAALSLVLLALVSALIWLLMRITRVNRLVG
ncbi:MULTISPECIES: ABC transporter permease [Pseudomonas]|uniref:ABC transporter permease n=1 Tax=Pseudomonas piscis TaxID=2614538 RepID=U7A7J4_9PSED|nr:MULTISPECIES: ABC transporter permease [Pseudomonas]AZC15771.1 Spermidine/putrescine import ABC transporter permease protein PotB [Pseudomonas sp. CMR5c]ERO65589.1 polyamine ABC transporter permease [Pseudomonas piscis]MQA56188.1 ABC transporter permease subunit [Pseudomonas piscis]POA57061.1 ABC transporter permease [Pseudomonas sp. FW507-12TSA]WMN18154.1 ABC transporter permease [Pseudomonas piscis]